MFTPSTNVKLLRVPFDATYKNEPFFGSSGSQSSYFSGLTTYNYTGFQFQRKDNVIRVEANFDDVCNVNYVMYQNTNYGNKWFYAFVTKVEYANENVSLLYLKTDVYQTWLFDTQLKPSFVVREMLSATDDVIGANLVDENLETGEYVFPWGYSFNPAMLELWIIVATTADAGGVKVSGGLYSGIYTGVRYFACANSDFLKVNTFIDGLNALSKADAIVSIFTIPKLLLPAGVRSGFFLDVDTITINAMYHPITYDCTNALTTISGYIPKNNKLFTSPYNFLYASNQQGQEIKYRYEFFYNPADYIHNNVISFSIAGNIAPTPVALFIPQNYKGQDRNNNESLTMSGYPMCNWTTAPFAAWLAQNAVALPLGIAGSLASIGIAGATANPVLGAVAVGGVLSVAGEVGKVYEHYIQAPQSHGSGSTGSVNCAYGLNVFSLSPCQITADFAHRIDEFFTMFGYKTNRVKQPNVNNRPAFNYIKTIDVNITGDVPTEDMSELKAIYNTGITLWHDMGNYLNYAVNNK